MIKLKNLITEESIPNIRKIQITNADPDVIRHDHIDKTFKAIQKVDKKQNNDANASGVDTRILRSSGEKLNNEFSDEISEEKLKADYERNNS